MDITKIRYLKAIENYNGYIMKNVIYQSYNIGIVINNSLGNLNYRINQNLYFINEREEEYFIEVTEKEYKNQFKKIIQIY